MDGTEDRRPRRSRRHGPRFFDAFGRRYVVIIAPHERPGGRGLSSTLKALVFETEDGQWVGSVPIYHTARMHHFEDEELRSMLDEAVGRG